MRFAITLLAVALPAHGVFALPLEAVVIGQSSAYDQTALFETYKNHLGVHVTEKTAVAVGEALQQKYRLGGYSRPGYAIADSGVESGIIRIRLVEASVSRVEVNGSAGPHRQELERLASELPSSNSMRPEEIRTLLRQARRLPGLEVDVAAKPDDARTGGYVIALDSAWKPVEGSVKLSNRGTEAIGRNLVFARLVGNGLLGRSNTVGLFLTSAENSDNYFGGGVFANTALRGRTSLQFQAAATALEFETQGVVVQQGRDRWSATLRHLLQGASGDEIAFRGGMTVEDLDVEYNDNIAREERLRSINLGISRSARGITSQSLAAAELEHGLNSLGSRIDDYTGSGNGTEYNFTIASLSYVYVSRLNDNWTWRWDAVGQLSPDVLPSTKRFKVGGGRIGRGFEAAAVTGDRGIANKLELKRRLGGEPARLARADVYAFYDGGMVWRNDAGGRASATSAGVGFSMSGNRLSGYLEVAKPLTHADADGRKDPGIFVELSARF